MSYLHDSYLLPEVL